MGSVTNQTDKQAFKPEDWKVIPIFSYTNINDPCYGSNFQVLAHKNLPYVEAQKYDLFFNSQAEYISYLDGYYARFKSEYLVAGLHIEKGTEKRMCSTFHAVELYLERIPIRLYEITDMPLTQGLYMLQVALEGYQQMFPKTGYFDISPDMIGINKQGKVKIWINRNLSKNFPQFNKINHNKQESEFIAIIIKIIEECIDYSDVSMKFSQYYFHAHHRIGFKTAKNAIKEYCQKNKITAAKIMKSVLIVYRNNAEGSNHTSSFHTITEGEDLGKFTTPREMQKIKPRRSFHKIEDPHPYHFVKKQSLGDINSGALHMSFIRQPRPFREENFYPEPEQYPKKFFKKNCESVQKRMPMPQVSFHYNQSISPQTSPQNKARQMEKVPMRLSQTPMQLKFKKIKRKNEEEQKKNISNISKPIIFESTGGSYEIDSDIAKDLEFFNI